MNVARLFDASGLFVANVVRAKLSGVREDVAKLMELKVMPPEVTSGTPAIVVLAVLQVITFWIAASVAATSAGRATLPTTKQASARCSRTGAA